MGNCCVCRMRQIPADSQICYRINAASISNNRFSSRAAERDVLPMQKNSCRMHTQLENRIHGEGSEPTSDASQQNTLSQNSECPLSPWLPCWLATAANYCFPPFAALSAKATQLKNGRYSLVWLAGQKHRIPELCRAVNLCKDCQFPKFASQ